MKVTVGTDIIEVKRIQDAIENNNLKNTVFTEKEIAYCESKKVTKYQHYAGRFAAKEAVFKAISGYLKGEYAISWKNIEILNDERGRPYVNLIDIDAKRFDYKYIENDCVDVKNVDIDVSISHVKDYAIACVTITM